MKRHILFLLLFVLAFAECQLASPPEQTETLPGRRELIRSARRDVTWLWVYAAADSIQAQTYQELLAPVLDHPPNGQTILLRSSEEVSAEDLARYPLVLLGSAFPEDWREKMNQTATLSVVKGHFSFADQAFTDQRDVLQLFYHPNPWNSDWPMHLMLGNNDRHLITLIRKNYQNDWSSMFWSNWGYTVRQDGFARLLGHFADSTWLLDREVHFTFSPQPDTLLQSPEAIWLAHDLVVSDTLLDRLHREYKSRRDSLVRLLGEGPLPRLSFHIYPSVEYKGMVRQNMEPAEGVAELAEVHLVVNSLFRGDHAGEDMRVLVSNRLGEPAQKVLESGLSVRFAPNWGNGKGYGYWAQRLYNAEHIFSIQEMLDEQLIKTSSPLLVTPSAAVLVDFLLDRYGTAGFSEMYQTWTPTPDTIAKLEKSWQVFLKNKLADPVVLPRQSVPTVFLRGYTFAHEGYQVYNGFGSQAARTSLEALLALGTDAVSIVPYSFMSDPKVPSVIPIVSRAGTENDAATLFAHFTAKSLGMFSLLKPQIWVRGSWPGAINFASAADWEAFFVYYDRWMTHYVLLAEMYGFDAIAVGTELAQSTLQHPEYWRKMLTRWRKLYQGHITYAANWGEEIEKLTLWSELDVVGCNCYYPLADSTTSGLDSLLSGADRMLQKVKQIADRAGKPVWLTEIGYRSVTTPWYNPHAEPLGRAYQGAHQALAYEAIFQTLQQHPEVRGVFWWKWPSYLAYADRRKTGFTPLGKPAEKVVRKWFKTPQ